MMDWLTPRQGEGKTGSFFGITVKKHATIRFSADLLKQMGWKAGDKVQVAFHNNQMLIRKQAPGYTLAAYVNKDEKRRDLHGQVRNSFIRLKVDDVPPGVESKSYKEDEVANHEGMVVVNV